MSRLNHITSKLRLPLIAAPMFLVSGPELVIAACKAGIVGSFPAPNARTPEIFREWITKIKSELEGTDAVWAANLIMHSSYPRRLEDLAIAVEAQAPIVITALGSPKDAVAAVHEYGGLVFADVNNVEFAKKAVEAGADGLVLVSSGAGGHTGQISGFAFIDSVREFFDGPIILAGAISNGRGIRAAEILGADLAYMGTSFIAAEESMALPDYKNMVVTAGPSDIICSSGITGVPANWLRQSLELVGYDPATIAAAEKADFSNHHQDTKAWKHVWSAGQGVGTIHKVEPVQDIVDRLVAEYDAAAATPSFNR